MNTFVAHLVVLLLAAFVGNAASRATPQVKREAEPLVGPPVRPPAKREAEPSMGPPVRPPAKREADPST